jgi:glutathione S-transferase
VTRTLYTTAKSANGRKPLALVHHLGLGDIAIVEVDVYRGAGRAPSYLATNPAGKIPTLVDGDLALPESNAILAHLGGLGDEPARRRAELLRWMFWEASEWQPALSIALRDPVAHALGLAPAGAPRWDAAARVLSLLDAHLADRAFVVGDRVSIADWSLAGMMTYTAVAPLPAGHAHVAAWYARVAALPAWRATAVAPWR